MAVRSKDGSKEHHQPLFSAQASFSQPSDAFARATRLLDIQRPPRSPRLKKIAAYLLSNQAELAEKLLAEYLARRPDDVDALRLMARIKLRLGYREKALELLARCLELAPDLIAARYEFAKLLLQLNRLRQALDQLDNLLAQDSHNPLFRQLKANILQTIGDNEQSLAICEQLAAENPGRAESWISLGHAFRAVGASEESIASYRRAIEIRPSFGRAYWSLANMKTVRFSDADIAAMQKQLERTDISNDDRFSLQFSLGKAFEDIRAYDRSFEHYSKGNAGTRLLLEYNPDTMTARVASNKALFTREFFRGCKGVGCAANDPIFVLGRPRSGSTLVEQILSSHPDIEGTAELPYIGDFARQLKDQAGASRTVGYLEILSHLGPEALANLGEEYLKSSSIYRKLGRPFFIDKKPANFWHIGMIHLILPNAKIIDVRRHPVASGFSIFKQYFSKTNLRLTELGRHFRDYVELMAHFDSVLPGKVHRLIYEDMVAAPEAETRKLLDYLGLPFEESCLRFYETKRAVLTPSSEQVRKPISGDAVDHWKNYEPWLGPLIKSLGSALTCYPGVPEELR